MILKKLVEAKIGDENIIVAIKEQKPGFSVLRDSTLAEILNVWKKENEINKPRLNEEDIKDFLDWLDSYDDNNIGEFAAFNGDNLTTYAYTDFAENDERLGEAVRRVAISYGNLTEDGRWVDGDGATPSLSDICKDLLSNEAEKAKVLADERTEEIPLWAYRYHDNPEDLDAVKDHSQEEIDHFMDLIDKYNAVERKAPEYREVTVEDIRNAYEQLSESLKEEVEEVKAEEEVIEEKPAEEPVENVAPDQELSTAFTATLNELVKHSWDLINEANGALVSLDYYYQDEEHQDMKSDISKILNEIIDNDTINVGMLYKALELVSSKVSDLIKTGTEQAEEITAEKSAEE